jgi:hypothetical protein
VAAVRWCVRTGLFDFGGFVAGCMATRAVVVTGDEQDGDDHKGEDGAGDRKNRDPPWQSGRRAEVVRTVCHRLLL